LAVLAMGAVLVGGGSVALAAPRAGAGHQAASQAGAAARHDGRAAAAGGIISTVAGGVGGPGLATTISLVSGTAGLGDVAFAAGQLYMADTSVRQVSAQSDMLTTPAGTGAAGPLGAGGPAARASIGAAGVAVDHAGNVVIADSSQRRVEVLPHATGTFYGRAMIAGHIYPVAGDGSAGLGGTGVPATKTALSGPHGVAVDAAGNLVIADVGRLSPTSGARVRVVAATSGTFYGQQMTKGDIYTVAGTTTGTQFSGDGGPATEAGLGNFIFGIRVDAAGNLVIGDSDTERVRVVAASTGRFYGKAMTAGDIYTVAGNGTEGFGGDGGPATRAFFDDPTGVALDAAGNLLIADTINNRVRAVAARTGTFYGQAMTAGDVYTIAGGGTGGIGDGGPATKAVLSFPAGLTVEPSGTVIIADAGFGRVRVVAAQAGTFFGKHMTAGDIYTVAGSGGVGFCCDGAPATTAQMIGPFSVTTDPAGNMVIADVDNNRIRAVAAATGTFYGQTMTKGDIYTVAGDGKRGNPHKWLPRHPDGAVQSR
jgi:hypothetical protein